MAFKETAAGRDIPDLRELDESSPAMTGTAGAFEIHVPKAEEAKPKQIAIKIH